ncbi:NAD(P)-dependent oxidoreductase [Shimia sp.]|uniref:NAD(P)-dependent oxidoreductase n=1 Tax=Shimia sp. TaxID=1954381 RepID=UPI0032976E77
MRVPRRGARKFRRSRKGNTTMKIGFIGLGLMGRAMVQCLQNAGHDLVVMGNRDRTGVEQALARGAQEATSARALTQASDVVMLCVSTSEQVENLVYGEGGILSAVSDGQIVLDFGTSLPESTKKIGAAMAEKGVHYMDCPLGRTPASAVDGKLNIMAGGSQEAFDSAKPILDQLGENIFHLGPLGSGNTIKLLNNYIGMTFVATISEAYATADAAGISRGALYDVVGSGPLHSMMLDMVSAYMVGGENKMEFTIANASKDLGYFRQMAGDLGLENRMSEASSAMYAAATEDGAGGDLVPQIVDWVTAQSRNG